MGRIKILENKGDGLYRAQVVYDTGVLEQEKALLEEKDAALTSEIVDKLIEYNDCLLNPGTCTAEKIAVLRQQISMLKIRRAGIQTRIDYIDKYGLKETIFSMWCADLTTDLAIDSELGSCEIPEYREGIYATGAINIRPAYSGRAVHSPTRDGWIRPNAALGPFSSYLYRSIFPAWQKWKPTYRYGTISNINTDNDTATVDLDPVSSSESEHAREDLPINQDSRLVRVPIEYLDCNAEAFTDGRKVIVEFVGQGQDDPLIIGFEDNPAPCFIPWENWPGPNFCDNQTWYVTAFYDAPFGSRIFVYGLGPPPGIGIFCPTDIKDPAVFVNTPTGQLKANTVVPNLGANSRYQCALRHLFSPAESFTKIKFTSDFQSTNGAIYFEFRTASGNYRLYWGWSWIGSPPVNPNYFLAPGFSTGSISYTDVEFDISAFGPIDQIIIRTWANNAGSLGKWAIDYIDLTT